MKYLMVQIFVDKASVMMVVADNGFWVTWSIRFASANLRLYPPVMSQALP